MLPEELLKGIDVGETGDWEFKSAKGGFPQSFWETYSAMANTNGGTVILGVREEEGGVQLEGLSPEQIDQYQKKLWDDLNNPGKVNRNLLSASHVQIVKQGVKNLLAIHIPRAARTQGPIYLGPNPLTNTFRRYHEGDYRCSEDQVRRMLADASAVPRDSRVLRGFTIGDLDSVSLDQYRRRFSASKPDHPWGSLPNAQFLEVLGGWRRDQEAGEEGITLAGLLMFGRHPAITNAVPSYFVDYREKLDPELRWNHRICPDGTWEPNLFQFYQKIWPHLSADLKIPFYLEGIQRIDETPVHKALREALVNALIHADYFAPGGVIIERYRDRFLLDNPGTLLVPFEQLRRGGISECRNKTLQMMFMMIGGGEKAGSGIHRIQNEWKNQHWRAPAFSVQEPFDRIRLVLPMVSLIPEPALMALEQRFGNQIKRLKKLEIEALVTAEIEGEVSNTRLQELDTVHPAEITQILQGLCVKGMLISDHRRRWACYKIPKDSSHNDLNSSHKVEMRRRTTPSQIRSAIQELCRDRYLEASKIAAILKRTQNNLRNRFLTQMVREGFLELRYPEAPNRPDQAYRTKSSGEREAAE